MAGKRYSLFLRSAFFVVFGAIALSIFLGHDGSGKVTMGHLKNTARSSLPPDWPVISEAAINKGTFIGYIVSKKSPLDIMESGKIVENLARSAGFHERSSISSGARYRKVFCRQSTALDVEIYRTENKGIVIESGAYWSSQKGDSRYCR